MPRKECPSIEYLRQCLRYQDGKLYWLERPRDHFKTCRNPCQAWNKRWPGKEAGNICKGGKGKRTDIRWQVGVNGKNYFRSTLVWAIVAGESGVELDHIDRDPLNDRIENLRVATRSQNHANKSKSSRNTTGFKGVSWNKDRCKYETHSNCKGVRKFLGHFDTPEEAHAVYMRALIENYGEFAFSG